MANAKGTSPARESRRKDRLEIGMATALSGEEFKIMLEKAENPKQRRLLKELASFNGDPFDKKDIPQTSSPPKKKSPPRKPTPKVTKKKTETGKKKRKPRRKDRYVKPKPRNPNLPPLKTKEEREAEKAQIAREQEEAFQEALKKAQEEDPDLDVLDFTDHYNYVHYGTITCRY